MRKSTYIKKLEQTVANIPMIYMRGVKDREACKTMAEIELEQEKIQKRVDKLLSYESGQ